MNIISRVLEVSRDDPLTRIRVASQGVHMPGPGRVLLHVERFGISSNNLTYALLGDLLGHWKPFPTEAGWGRVPAWGVATVIGGDSDIAPVGSRFAGYLPMASHVTVAAVRSTSGLEITAPERKGMSSIYRELRRIDIDDTWDDAWIDPEVLMLPVSLAAGVLDHDLQAAGINHVLISSASSKTASAVAQMLSKRGVHVIGLSDHSRKEIVIAAGGFDEVFSYEEFGAVSRHQNTTYLDVAGDPAVTRRIAEHLGTALTQHIAVGGTRLALLDLASIPQDAPPGPPVIQFDVGSRKTQLVTAFGRAYVDEVEQAARRTLVPWAATHLRVRHLEGLDAAGAAWTALAKRESGVFKDFTITP